MSPIVLRKCLTPNLFFLVPDIPSRCYQYISPIHERTKLSIAKATGNGYLQQNKNKPLPIRRPDCTTSLGPTIDTLLPGEIQCRNNPAASHIIRRITAVWVGINVNRPILGWLSAINNGAG